MIPPVREKDLAIDPGQDRLQIACIDETGKLLETAVIFPRPPKKSRTDRFGLSVSTSQYHR